MTTNGTQGLALGCAIMAWKTSSLPTIMDDRMQPSGDGTTAALEQLVRPPDWRNPHPRSSYNLVVIGGGTAGLVSAVGAASLGARVALIERDRLGGDCLLTGCVPSKALLRTARALGELRRADALGVRVAGVDIDFSAVMLRMRQRQTRLAASDSAERLAQLGVDVFFGNGAFVGARQIVVGSHTLRFRRAVIATGSRPVVPAIDGLAATPYLTNETIFELNERPNRLLVVGGGAIGCELSQAFARLGSRVTIFDQVPRLLAGEDPDASAVLQRALGSDGIEFQLGTSIVQVLQRDGAAVVRFRRPPDGPLEERLGDRILVATGRTSNVDGLDLGRAGIRTGPRSILVDDRLRTTNRRVFAAGDVCSRFQFTHAADAMARIVIHNALFFGRRRVSALTIPWCTYTDPEIAHVGVSVEDAARGRGVHTITVPMSDVDRAVLDDQTDGFLRVHHDQGRLLGCTIVAAHAGELIGQAGDAIARGATLNEFSASIHPYPTQAEALRRAGDTYRRSRLTPRLRRSLERYFRVARW
jgi:pyruvate/2-oxoglutarate dehydrogenase complex dihydrolipoamide dehydrogenase (E3) component